MNILVCISRVPDTATRVLVGQDGKTIDTQGVKYVVNPYDEYGIEEGLRLKEKNGGTVTAITVGLEASTDVLRTALAMGADKAVLIKSDGNRDSWFVAKNIAEFAKEMNPDLILLGRQSVDYDSFEMPSLLGEFLGLPSISVVSKLDISDGKVKAERDIEGGKEIVETTLPCLISCQKGINEPRYPKLPDIMKAKSKPIDMKEPVQTEAQITVLDMSLPLKSRVGKIVGDTEADVDELVRLLHEEAKII
jgi:electron transfer flavoprotein beta subunit